jgi:hypothetical protein
MELASYGIYYDILPIGIVIVDTRTGMIEYRNNYILEIYGEVKTVKDIYDVGVEKVIKVGSDVENKITIYYTERDSLELLKINRKTDDIDGEYMIKCMSDMSKKVKVPLNNISLLTDMLEKEKNSIIRQNHIKLIKQCSSKLYQIMNDSLDYTELLLGNVKLSNKSINIRDEIDTIKELVENSLSNKQVEFKISIGSNISEIIQVDIERLKQVLINLLSNAIKFTMRGNIQLIMSYINKDEYDIYINKHCIEKTCECGHKVCIGLSCKLNKKCKDCTSEKCEHVESRTLYLKFDIIDTGCGVNSDYMDITTRQNSSISFVIIRNIIQLMNGVLWLDWTELNKGSKFSFIIEVQSKVVSRIDILDHSIYAMIIIEDKKTRLDVLDLLLEHGIEPIITSTKEEVERLYDRTMNGVKKKNIVICELDKKKSDVMEIISFLQEKTEHSKALIIGIGTGVYSGVKMVEYNRLENILNIIHYYLKVIV